ncbi:MAG: hypothetical protein AAF913_04360 [Pseudomonadota bacterium]
MTLHPVTLLREAAALFLTNFIWLYGEFFAARVASLTLLFLLFPGQAVWLVAGGEAPAPIFYFVNASSLIGSAIFAVVSLGAARRLWGRVGGDASPPPWGVVGWTPVLVISLGLDHVVTAGILFLLVPGLILQALTTTVLPLLAIEVAGWRAVERAIAMARPHLLVLTVAWSVIILPWLSLFIFGGPAEAQDEVALFDLWLRAIFSDLFTPAFIGFSLCLSVVTYQHLIEAEGGGPDDRLSDIFR